MSAPKIIGITGGIGSGKSTISDMLRKLGYKVFDADLIAKKLQNQDKRIIDETKLLFGDEVYTTSGLDRKWLARIVFNNPKLLMELNNIVHPVVKEEIIKWIDLNISDQFLFVESAILIECGFDSLVDSLLLVSADEEVRIQRVMQRDGSTREQVKHRIENQLSDENKLPLASYVIRTDDGLPLIDKINAFINSL